MSRGRSLRRLWRHRPYVFVAAAILFASGLAATGGTFASFTADTENTTSTLPGGWIGPATSLTVGVSGYDAQLAWTPGTHGPVTGQQLYSLDNGSSSSCPASGYSLAATMASASTSSYTQSNPAATTLSGKIGVSTLQAAITTTTATSIQVHDSSSFPASNGFTIQIDSEQMTVTAGAGTNTWTVTRGVNGTTAATHANNAPLNQVSVSVASASGFPPSGSYTIQVDSEQMTVTSGQGTTTWIVTRGANSTTIATHASGVLVTQVPDPIDGHYYCYRMVSTSASNWTATASFPATQLGLVATAVTITDCGAGNCTKGTPDGKNATTGDTVTITLNQQTNLTTNASSGVCQYVDGSGNVTILLGDTTCSAVTTDPYDFKLTGVTSSQTNQRSQINATRTVSTSAPWTVTYLLEQSGKVVNNGTWTLTPSSTVLTSAVTDQAPACTSATYNCLPTYAQDASHGF